MREEKTKHDGDNWGEGMKIQQREGGGGGAKGGGVGGLWLSNARGEKVGKTVIPDPACSW